MRAGRLRQADDDLEIELLELEDKLAAIFGAGGAETPINNPAPVPAIQYIQQTATLEPYVTVGASGYLNVHGVGLTAGGMTPMPQIGSDDPNITLSSSWAGVDNMTTDDSQVDVSYTVRDGARVGNHTLTLTTAGGQATGTFGVYDNTPNITNCTANGGSCNFTSGNTYNVTLSGQYFGTVAPLITIAGSWGPPMGWTITGWNDNTITGVVTVPTGDSSGAGALTLLSGGYTGQGMGYDPAPQPQPGNTKWPVSNTAPAISVTITSNGSNISQGTCSPTGAALISAGGATPSTAPQMPPLSYGLVGGPGGTVTWQLTVNDNRGDGRAPEVRAYASTTGTTQNWGTLGTIGGNATLTASYTGGWKVVHFCILGQNASASSVLSYIQNNTQGYLWALPFLLQTESSTQQFNVNNNSNTPHGYPLSDGPNGWGCGLMQLSNRTATTDQMWNWQSNTVAGMQLLATSESAADVFWLSN